MQDTLTARILAFAQHLDTPDRDAVESARDRAWIDAQGKATEAGRGLVFALGQVVGTRTSLRGNF